MCTKPKVPKPPPAPTMPTVMSPELIDDAALAVRDRERRRRASMYGRQSTVLGAGAGMPPTSGAKMLLGA